MAIATVMTMKMISYAHINHNLRQEARVKKVKNGWPNNISIESIIFLDELTDVKTFIFLLHFPRWCINKNIQELKKFDGDSYFEELLKR